MRIFAVDPEEERFLPVAVLRLGPDVDRQTILGQCIVFLGKGRQNLCTQGANNEGMVY